MKPPVYNPDWPDDVKALYKHDTEEIWDRSLAPHLWNQYHNLLDYYLAIAGSEPLQILDIGCAQGTLALLLAEQGHHVMAVDIRAQFLEYAKSRYTHGDIRFLTANAIEDELSGEYDLIFANQIIEHLVYPDVLVDRLKSLLGRGGRLVVTTPNGDYLKNNLPSYNDLGDPRQWEHLQFSADGDGHFYAYLGDELRDVFHHAGLLNIQVHFFETPFISGHMKVRYLHGILPSPVLRVADRLLLAIPGFSRKFSHQLLVMGCVQE